MEVRLEKSLHTYMELVEDLLLKNEATNNLMLGLLDRGHNNAAAYQEGVHLGLVEEGNEVIFAFMQTPPNHWILADVNHVDEQVIKAVVQFLYREGLDVPSVLGPNEEVETLVTAWSGLSKKKAEVEMEQLIYQLDHVNVTPDETGKLIQATSEHKSIIAKWLYQFGVEANMYISRLKAETMATNYTDNRSIYLWVVDGKPVSMVNNSRKTKNGVTINAVFTPDRFKRKGYATSAVAALSKKLLEDGFKFCSLYTDAANPTSNSIYRKIGYYEIGSSIVYQFES
ncbi:GNAT family N-acetyltransferase [Ornithinibacillus sp. L9]|uniref:GNAT family N-acetyltransferase n=1 Tax=Ornithinibacillus caprae TaxID=2678566 RepID=A0A6N8FMI8_9BACI|nr:GNAT family N-acetyltransferase [Ornithinibacillus caprae]MUK90695.1 GNAT family N-acetyltransferase [Ornithinibacillus caprae]